MRNIFTNLMRLIKNQNKRPCVVEPSLAEKLYWLKQMKEPAVSGHVNRGLLALQRDSYFQKRRQTQ
jgi:hypothetical protein